MPADRNYWLLVETVWEEISIYEGEKVFRAQYEKAPPAARLLFAAHWCQSEVRNGGLKQFFSNSTGILAPEAVEGFTAINLPKLAQVVQNAMALFGSPYPRAKSARTRVLRGPEKAAIATKLDVLDDEFFRHLASDNGGFENAANHFAKADGG